MTLPEYNLNKSLFFPLIEGTGKKYPKTFSHCPKSSFHDVNPRV